jgi:Cu(I)/Ag(I) efflux system membrane fusion protein
MTSSSNEPNRSEGGLRAPAHYSTWRKFWWWFDFLVLVKLARLRFIAVLLAIGAVIAYWDTLGAYWQKWTRPTVEIATASADSEFWCPMHPTIIRDHPDKCPICGMPLSKRKKGDKSEDEPLPAGVVARVQLTPYRVALAGIQTTTVGYRPLTKELRTVGFVEFDERKLQRITARVAGKSRIDKLFVNVTGQMVREGDPLARLYAPDLVVTVQNLLDARRAGNPDLERITRDRLRLWGIGDAEIADIVKKGVPTTHVTIRSPMSGHIIKKYQVEGEYVEEGARLFDLADLSTVWLEAPIYEDDLAFLREGLEITATTKAFPTRTFSGRISFVHPHLDAATRTLRVRFDVANPAHELRPGMYANVNLEVPTASLDLFRGRDDAMWRDELAGEGAVQAFAAPSPFGMATLVQAGIERAIRKSGQVLAVPESAVIDTGSRKIVYREASPGVYDGVLVEVGPRSGGFYPVVSGLSFGDRVASAGAFLIDAETRLTGGAGSTYFGASGGPQQKHEGHVHPTSTPTAEPALSAKDAAKEAKIRANLAKLSPADRALAQSQRFCAVLTKNRLGSMDVPIKLMIEGKPVFLCCSGCEEEARENAAATLVTVERLKAAEKSKSSR